MTFVGIGSNGQLHTQNQVQDYALRGDTLEEFTILSFFINTYEEDQGRGSDSCSTRGQVKNPRIPYRSSHWKFNKKTRVLRSDGHRNLPNIIGQWFPRRDTGENYHYYCASMLMLLKPWRNLRTDLKDENESWESAFENFVANHGEEENVKFTLSNIQFFHECDSAVQRARDSASDQDTKIAEEEEGERGDQLEDDENDETTERVIHSIQETQTSWAERQYAQIAVDIATLCGIFHSGSYEWNIGSNLVKSAKEEDQVKLMRWKEEMSSKIQANDQQIRQMLLSNQTHEIAPTIQSIKERELLCHSTWDEISTGENCLTAVDPSELNEDQVCFTICIVLSNRFPE